jgi:hypothetical protein
LRLMRLHHKFFLLGVNYDRAKMEINASGAFTRNPSRLAQMARW